MVNQSIDLEAAEQEIFGSTQTAIGGYLLGLWGIDPDVVNTVCTFKDDEGKKSAAFSPLTAVFAANHLVTESGERRVGELEKSLCIRQVGCVDQIPLWRSFARSQAT